MTYGKVSLWLWKSLENSGNFFSYFVATLKKTHRVLGVKSVEKSQQKLASNLIQCQFVMPIVIKDFFTFTASDDQ